MTTTRFDMTGKVSWARIFPRNMDTKFDKNGVFTMDFYPDEASWVKFRAQKLKLEVNEDKDGDEYIKLARKNKGKVGEKEVTFGPPDIFKDAETLWDVTKDGYIGNGSTVTVKVETYDTVKGRAHRLVAVRIDDYVAPPPRPEKKKTFAEEAEQTELPV